MKIGGFRLAVTPMQSGLIAESVRSEVSASPPTPRPIKGPHKDALTFAAWYLAGVLCEYNDHRSFEDWPCPLCVSKATDILHAAATTKITQPKQGKNGGKHRKKPENAKRNTGRITGKGTGRNTGGRRGKR